MVWGVLDENFGDTDVAIGVSGMEFDALGVGEEAKTELGLN